MKTLILPGFSPKNKIWAEEVKAQFKLPNEAEVIVWNHWNSESVEQNWIDTAMANILNQIGDQKINIIAKSVGTLVAMRLLARSGNSIEKIVLCGIPLNDLSENDKQDYQVLKNFPADKIFCIQNQEDNHGSFLEVEAFLHFINPQIKLISKPSTDHEYPYYSQVLGFIED